MPAHTTRFSTVEPTITLLFPPCKFSASHIHAAGNAIANSEANAFSSWGNALANSEANANSKYGDAIANSQANANSNYGDAIANSESNAFSKYGNAEANSESNAFSNHGDAVANSVANAYGRRLNGHHGMALLDGINGAHASLCLVQQYVQVHHRSNACGLA